MLWTAVGKYSNTIIAVGVTAVLTRLLTPADFGIVAMVVVISGFMSILAEAGLSTAVVQKRELDDTGLSSLFWVGLGLGAGMALVLAASSPLVAMLFKEPRLKPVVALMGLGFLFVALGRVPNGLLERSFRFREIALADFVAAVAGGALGITGALLGFGYYALVAETLAFALVAALMRLYLSGFRPRRVFQASSIRSVGHYSGGVTAFTAINYWARNLDKALIGRFLGAAELGFYGRAYALMLVPIQAINGVVNPTLHPVLATLQHDREQMAHTYLKIAKTVAIVAIPTMCVMASLAPELVRTIWGPKWGPSVPVFLVLCIVGAVQPVGATFGAVFLSLNRTKWLAISGLVNAVILMTGMAIGVQHGISGVAIGYSIAYGVIFFPTMYLVVVVLLKRHISDMLTVLGSAVAVAAIVLSAMFGFNTILRGRWASAPHMVVGILVGLCVWIAACAVIERSVLVGAWGMLPEGFRARLARRTAA